MHTNHREVLGLCAALVLIGCGDGASDAEAEQAGASQGGEGNRTETRAPASPAGGAPGALDPTFGTAGKVTSNLGPSGPLRVALQNDGKIVVATTLSNQFGVIRYLPNGNLDTTFGAGGIVRTSLTAGFDIPQSIAIDPSGKIVVAGSASDASNSTTAIGLARYLPNGSLDASFGRSGIVITSLFGFQDIANVVLLQPDGKILIGGSALTCFGRRCPNDTALVRYDTNGDLDTTFGSRGQVVFTGNGPVDALALESDGSSLLLNDDALVSAGPAAIQRFNAAGSGEAASLDGTLPVIATGGPATFQADGKVVSGRGAHGAGRFGIDVQVFRSTLSNSPDPGFSSPAFAFDQEIPNAQNLVQAIIVDSRGRILVGGIAPMASPPNAFGLARLSPSGALDTSFGKGGKVTTQFSTNPDDESQLMSLAVQADGKIVAAGQSRIDQSGNTGISLARYIGD